MVQKERGSPLRKPLQGQVLRVAIYCRVSTTDQSCSRQERDLRAYAEKAGYEVVGVWKETASGSKNNRVERPKSFLSLMSESKTSLSSRRLWRCLGIYGVFRGNSKPSTSRT